MKGATLSFARFRLLVWTGIVGATALLTGLLGAAAPVPADPPAKTEAREAVQ